MNANRTNKQYTHAQIHLIKDVYAYFKEDFRAFLQLAQEQTRDEVFCLVNKNGCYYEYNYE